MVVAVGLTLVVPVADVEVKLPGVMAMVAAPFDVQLSVLLEPEVMPAGSAVKEAMVGTVPFAGGGVVEPQPVRWAAINIMTKTCGHRPIPAGTMPLPAFLPGEERIVLTPISAWLAMFVAP